MENLIPIDTNNVIAELLEDNIKQESMVNEIKENLIEASEPNLGGIDLKNQFSEIPVFTLSEPVVVKKMCGFIKENNKACRKKILDTEKHCEEHSVGVSTSSKLPKYTKETAAQSLFKMQFSIYILIEMGAPMINQNMSGLCEDLKDQQEAFEEVFEKLYEEYGGEFIDAICGPIFVWAALTFGSLGGRFMRNKSGKLGELITQAGLAR